MTRGLKYTEATDAGPIDGLERIGIAKQVAGVYASRATSLQQIADLSKRIAGNGGSIEIGPDGSIDFLPAPGVPDGTTGLYASTPDLGAPGVNRMPLLWMHAGQNQAGAAIRASAGAGARAAFEVHSNAYSTTVPRLYIESTGTLRTQTNVVLSGSQDLTSGLIRRGTNQVSMLDIWSTIRQAITVRAPQILADQSSVLAVKSAGLVDDTPSGNFIYSIDFTGTHKWGSVADNVNPASLATITLGPVVDRLTATHLDIPLTGDVRIGAEWLGGKLNVKRTNAGPVGVFHTTGAANGNIIVQAVSTAAVDTIIGFSIEMSTAGRGIGFRVLQTGSGPAELYANNVGGGNAFVRTDAGFAQWSFGSAQMDGNKFKICRDGTLTAGVIELTTAGMIGFTPGTADGAYYTMTGSNRVYWKYLPNTAVTGAGTSVPFVALGEIVTAAGHDANFVYTVGHGAGLAGADASGWGGFRDIWEQRNWNGTNYLAKKSINAIRGATYQADGKGAFFPAYTSIYTQTTDNLTTVQTADSFVWHLIEADRSVTPSAGLHRIGTDRAFVLSDTRLLVALETAGRDAIGIELPDLGGSFIRFNRIGTDIATINGYGQIAFDLSDTGAAGGSTVDLQFRGREIATGSHVKIDDVHGARLDMLRPTGPAPGERLTVTTGLWTFEAINATGSITIGSGSTVVIEDGGSVESHSTIFARAGMTVGWSGGVNTPPTVGTRLRVDRTDGGGATANAAIEMSNGTATLATLAYLTAGDQFIITTGKEVQLSNATTGIHSRFSSTVAVIGADFGGNSRFRVGRDDDGAVADFTSLSMTTSGPVISVNQLGGTATNPTAVNASMLSTGRAIALFATQNGTGSCEVTISTGTSGTNAFFRASTSGGTWSFGSHKDGTYQVTKSNAMTGNVWFKMSTTGIAYIPKGLTVGDANGAFVNPSVGSRLRIDQTDATTGPTAAIIEFFNGATLATVGVEVATSGGKFIITNANAIQLKGGANVLATFNADKSLSLGNGSINTYGQHSWNADAAGSGGISGTDYLFIFNPSPAGQGFNLTDAVGTRLAVMRSTGSAAAQRITNASGQWNIESLHIPSGGSFVLDPGSTMDLSGVLFAKAGMTVGANSYLGTGSPPLPPTKGTRLRIDATEEITPGSNQFLSAIEFADAGLSVQVLGLDSAGGYMTMWTGFGLRLRPLTTFPTGAVYAEFRNTGVFSLATGKFTSTSSGVVRATGGFSVGSVTAVPSVTARLRIDQTDGAGSHATIEFWNSFNLSTVYAEAGALGRFIVQTPNAFDVLVSGNSIAKFNADTSMTFASGSINSYGQHAWNATRTGTGTVEAIDFAYKGRNLATGTIARFEDFDGAPRFLIQRRTGALWYQSIAGLSGLFNVAGGIDVKLGLDSLGGTIIANDASGLITMGVSGQPININAGTALNAAGGVLVGPKGVRMPPGNDKTVALTEVDLVLGSSMLFLIRNTTYGGSAVVVYDAASSTPVTVVFNSGGPVIFVTTVATTNQVQLKNRTGGTGVSMITTGGSGMAGTTVAVIPLIADID